MAAPQPRDGPRPAPTDRVFDSRVINDLRRGPARRGPRDQTFAIEQVRDDPPRADVNGDEYCRDHERYDDRWTQDLERHQRRDAKGRQAGERAELLGHANVARSN